MSIEVPSICNKFLTTAAPDLTGHVTGSPVYYWAFLSILFPFF